MTLLHTHAAVVSEDQLVAAVLHDVVEDTPVTIETIERRYGPGVASMVFDLTDHFTHAAYPHLNRAARKEREAARLGSISRQAQDIKLADLISNTSSIVDHDPGFARIYLAEKARILDAMTDGDRTLYRLAKVALSQGRRKLL